MKILFLTNNENTRPLSDWLASQGEEIVLYGDRLTLEQVAGREYDMAISFNYRYLIPGDVIDSMKGHIINLHTSLLPWNRGSSPNFWSFWENSPKGVTIHLVDETLDTGAYLFQRELFFDEDKESFASSYETLMETMMDVFKENWMELKAWQLSPYRREEKGSYHTMKEFRELVGDFYFTWDDNVAMTKKRLAEYRNKTGE